MYSILLDNTGYYTGTYASVGQVENGINFDSLPNETDIRKLRCYRLVDVIENITVTIPVVNPTTGAPEYDDNNMPRVIQEVQPVTKKVWVFDEAKLLSEVLVNIRQNKIDELNLANKKRIYLGITVDTMHGSEHFSLTDADQKNLKNVYDIVKQVGLSVPYHADNTECRSFSPKELSDIYLASQLHIMTCNTLCNALNTWVRRCLTEEEISAITYDSILPEDLQTTMLDSINTAQQAINALTV